MLSYIKGTVALVKSEYAVIESGGLGFKVIMPFSESSRLKCGEEAKVLTYMYIREDILDLYGFTSEESLNCFELLIGISGVGPKAAIAVLSVLSPQQLTVAVSSGDFNAIKQAPGIGAKIAQRIVLELKDKLKSVASPDGGEACVCVAEPADKNDAEQAALALISLGYTPQQSRDAVAKAGGGNVEEIIKNALKHLM